MSELMVKSGTVSARHHTAPEAQNLNSSRSGDIFTTNFFGNRPRTHRERCLRWGGEWSVGMSKKFVLSSDRSTVSARRHTAPEAQNVNFSRSGDIFTVVCSHVSTYSF